MIGIEWCVAGEIETRETHTPAVAAQYIRVLLADPNVTEIRVRRIA